MLSTEGNWYRKPVYGQNVAALVLICKTLGVKASYMLCI